MKKSKPIWQFNFDPIDGIEDIFVSKLQSKNKLSEEISSPVKDWNKEDFFNVQLEYDVIYKQFVDLLIEQRDVTDPEVQNLVRRHYQLIEHFWKPGKMSYISLARSYVEDPEVRPMYDSYHQDLAEYLSQAITHFARQELVL